METTLHANPLQFLELVPYPVFLLRGDPVGSIALHNSAAASQRVLHADPLTGRIRASCQAATEQILSVLKDLEGPAQPTVLAPCPENKTSLLVSIGPALRID